MIAGARCRIQGTGSPDGSGLRKRAQQGAGSKILVVKWESRVSDVKFMQVGDGMNSSPPYPEGVECE